MHVIPGIVQRDQCVKFTVHYFRLGILGLSLQNQHLGIHLFFLVILLLMSLLILIHDIGTTEIISSSKYIRYAVID